MMKRRMLQALANPFVTNRNVSIDRLSLTRECKVTRDSGS
jgi:hypothetical protein